MKYLLILVNLLFTLPAFSQCYIKYNYDDAGNRVQRLTVDCFVRTDTKDAVKSDPNSLTNTKNSNQNTKTMADSLAPGILKSGAYTFKIYPNPTLHKIQVEAEQTFTERSNKRAYVYDMRGKLLQEINITSNLFPIDFSSYSAGIYIVRIIAEGYKNEFEVVKH